MRNLLSAILAALGMGVLVGGIMGMIGSIFQQHVRTLLDFGPFNGNPDPDQIKFLGAIHVRPIEGVGRDGHSPVTVCVALPWLFRRAGVRRLH
jgi:hypothetical protein